MQNASQNKILPLPLASAVATIACHLCGPVAFIALIRTECKVVSRV